MTKQRRDAAEEPRPQPADPLADVDQLTHTRLRRGNNRRATSAYPYVSVIADGEVVVVYPDDETTRTWNEEGWDVVKAGFTKDRSELTLTKAIDDIGVGIRRYPKQRVCVHVTVKGFGRARASQPIGAGAVRRLADTFFFRIAEQVVIESR